MKRILNNNGFGIIEVIISLSLVTILVVSIGSVLGSVYKIYSASHYKVQAYSYAQEPVEILNGIKNEYFSCVCAPGGSDSCSGTTCTNSADSQTCELRDGFTSCWTQYPENMSSATAYYIEDSGGGVWQLKTLAMGTRETVPADPDYAREIIIENLGRNASGDIDPASTVVNYDTKKVTVNVYWTERGTEKSISLSNILTAWQNL